MGESASVTPQPEQPPQLRMGRSLESLPAMPALADGMRLRRLTKADARAYAELMQANGELDAWDEARVLKMDAEWIPLSDIFAVEDSEGNLLATACVAPTPKGWPETTAELGWVAAHPKSRGLGLGFVVCLASMYLAREKGYTDIMLHTDDFRLPALALYFRLGYEPILDSHPSYPDRWQKVREALGARGGGR